MRSRWLTVLAGGVAALLGFTAPPAVAVDYPATYKGTTANGGTVEFDVAADGVTYAPPAPRGGHRLPAASLRPHALLSYRQKGGIAGPRPSLVVSKNRWARVSQGSCTARFRLKPGAWRGLRAALRRARIGSIAGDYLPQRGADIITYVIKAHAGTVRIAPGAGPQGEEAMRKLGPLLKALDRTVSAGERKMARLC